MKKLPADAEAFFCDAVALLSADRGTFLAKACGADAALLSQMVALLTAHDGPDSILQPASPFPPTKADEIPGAVIGRYKLLQRIGEGVATSYGWRNSRSPCGAASP